MGAVSSGCKVASHSGGSSTAACGSAEAAAALPPQPGTDQYGMDVTAINWAILLDGPYRVYQKGRWYSVVDVAVGTRLNDKSLTKEQVDALVAEMHPEADE